MFRTDSVTLINAPANENLPLTEGGRRWEIKVCEGGAPPPFFFYVH